MKTAIISGTFDPITIGHMDIITRAADMFGSVVIAVSANSEKKCFLPDEGRTEAVAESVKHIPNVKVMQVNGLLAEFCKQFNNPVIVRGARSGSEFDYERSLFIINKGLGTPETVILPAESGMDHISSTYVRELIKYGKPLDEVVPQAAIKVINKYKKA
ncbi:MAG: pantetheine-phosphate adenylyltransferase [Clostridia bacterium]|nr:pantetheine-phosphate adenylyltransferase [Clostridia bacterium]